jgi:hypothetical protein
MQAMSIQENNLQRVHFTRSLTLKQLNNIQWKFVDIDHDLNRPAPVLLSYNEGIFLQGTQISDTALACTNGAKRLYQMVVAISVHYGASDTQCDHCNEFTKWRVRYEGADAHYKDHQYNSLLSVKCLTCIKGLYTHLDKIGVSTNILDYKMESVLNNAQSILSNIGMGTVYIHSNIDLLGNQHVIGSSSYSHGKYKFIAVDIDSIDDKIYVCARNKLYVMKIVDGAQHPQYRRFTVKRDRRLMYKMWLVKAVFCDMLDSDIWMVVYQLMQCIYHAIVFVKTD